MYYVFLLHTVYGGEFILETFIFFREGGIQFLVIV